MFFVSFPLCYGLNRNSPGKLVCEKESRVLPSLECCFSVKICRIIFFSIQCFQLVCMERKQWAGLPWNKLLGVNGSVQSCVIQPGNNEDKKDSNGEQPWFGQLRGCLGVSQTLWYRHML